MITRRGFLAGSAAVLGGCAITPAGVKAANATRLTFQVNLNGPVNPNYVYVVAIRVLTPPVGPDPKLSDPSQGPSPIVDLGSKNGVVGGLPTHYVFYTETSPNLYQCFRFPLQSEAPDPTDPTTPLNLTWPGFYVKDVIAGSGIDPRPTVAGGQYGTQLGFSIDETYLNQHTPKGQSVQIIQFNILTMNFAATGGSNIASRVMDAIGNQSSVASGTFVDPIQVNITTSGTYTDQTANVLETANDTFPGGSNLPYVDLVTPWSLTVSLP